MLMLETRSETVPALLVLDELHVASTEDECLKLHHNITLTRRRCACCRTMTHWLRQRNKKQWVDVPYGPNWIRSNQTAQARNICIREELGVFIWQKRKTLVYRV